MKLTVEVHAGLREPRTFLHVFTGKTLSRVSLESAIAPRVATVIASAQVFRDDLDIVIQVVAFSNRRIQMPVDGFSGIGRRGTSEPFPESPAAPIGEWMIRVVIALSEQVP
jgi:hypothetical protein